MKSRRYRLIFQAILLGGIVISAGLILTLTSWTAILNRLIPLSEQYLHEGDAFVLDDRLPEAVLAYRQAVEADGTNRKALQALVNAYQRQGRLRMAARYQAKLAGFSGTTASLLPTSVATGGQPIALKPLWISTPVEANPTGGILQDRLFLVAYEDGSVTALNKEDGSQFWQVRLPSPASSAPVIADDLILIGAQDGNLYALSRENGKMVWSYKTAAPIYAPSASDGERVYCASGDGSIYALEETHGQVLWKFSTQGPLHAQPFVTEGVVYFGSSDGKLYAVSALNGAPLWQDGMMTGGPIESQANLAMGRLVVGSGDGRVYALDPNTGGEYWRFSTTDSIYSQPVIDDEEIWVSSSGRTLSSIDFSTGKKRWQIEFASILRSSPALSENILYQIAESDPNLYLIDRKTGTLIEKVSTGDWIAAGPWIDGNRIFLLGKDGAVQAYQILR